LLPCLITCGILLLLLLLTICILEESKQETLTIPEYCDNLCEQTDSNNENENQDNHLSLAYIYNNVGVRYSLLTYITLSCIDYIMSEELPLLLVTDKKYGGFGFDPSQIGLLFMIASSIAF